MFVRTMETLAGGEWTGADSWVDVFDPVDVRQPVVRVPALTAAQVTAVYDAALLGFAVWRRTPALERAKVLAKAAVLLRGRAGEIALGVTTENGKTLREARGEVEKAADFLDYYAGHAREAYGSLLHDVRPDTRTSSQREPVGVVLAITPWNDPLLTPARKLSPALAAGNAVVLKPASETPAGGLYLARALHDAGLPAGVLSVVTGRTPEISGALLDDPRIAAVTAEMDVWRHEVFGPVIVVRLDDAVAAVNDSPYGLSAALFSDSVEAAFRFAEEVECGQIAINTTTSGWDVHHPFGGFKDSGSAFKEQGVEALAFYTRVKTVAIHFGR